MQRDTAGFSFKDSVDGDNITPFIPPADGTYLTFHYNTGHPNFLWKEICTTYVQAKSAVARQRIATVKVMVNGQIEQREIPVSFGNDELSRQLQSFGRVNDYDNTPRVDVVGETLIGGNKRSVQLQWQKIAWAAKYAVFTRLAVKDNSILEPVFPLVTTSETHATINLAAFSDSYVAVVACKTDDPCINRSETMNEVLLPRMHTEEQPVTIVVEPEISPERSNEIIPVYRTQASDDSQLQIDELNKKVANLEAQIAQSAQKQNVLEQRVAQLLAFIRNLFPFFR